jgi:hypothetical protein
MPKSHAKPGLALPYSLAEIRPLAPAEANTMAGALPSSWFGHRVDGLQPEDVITQVLENNLRHLDGLRRHLEGANQKGIDDVREAGDTTASDVLAGVEQRIRYSDLVKVVDAMKDGIAARRMHFKALRSTAANE